MHNCASGSWQAYAYGFTLIISLVMFAAVLIFTSGHCRDVLASTGVPGACGLGIGWAVFALAFLLLAGYSGRELYRTVNYGKSSSEKVP